MKFPKITQPGLVHALAMILAPAGAGITAFGAKKGLDLPGAAVVTVAATSGGSIVFFFWHFLEKQPVFEKAKAEFDDYFQKLVAAAREVPGLGASTQAVLTELEGQKTEILAALEKYVPKPFDEVLNELLDQKLAARGQIAAGSPFTASSPQDATSVPPGVVPAPPGALGSDTSQAPTSGGPQS